MSVKKVLEEVDFSPTKEDVNGLKKESLEIIGRIKEGIRKNKIDADVFMGGSLAKNTLVKKKPYDVDLFVRFDWEIDDISYLLEKILKIGFKKTKFKMEKIHGSRDYFRLSKDKNVVFEIIPVTRIKKPEGARNVTDLSYFHVNYVKRKLKNDMANQVRLTKAFMKAQGVYGAESYISGFSGYAVECLIINYKTLENMLKQLSKVDDRIIIDFEKKYKSKNDVLFGLNESKLQGPIVLVDPTWKERNVLAGLSRETFEKFKKAAREFLKKPSKKFFEDVKVDEQELRALAKKMNAEFVIVKLKTDRQEGDIAGTKMKKFSRFLMGEISKYFDVIKEDFVYNDLQESDFYLVLKSKGEIVRIGPPANLENAVKAFKKKNKSTFEKNGILHARIKVASSAKKFIESYKKKEPGRVKEMGINGLTVL